MAPGGSTIDVLHVDDDEDFTALAERFLGRESEAIRVETEPDPVAARDRLVAGDAEAFDCVVSDLDMPGLDGLALLGAVRDARPDLPFILFTGKGSEEVASEAIAAGVTDYLQKSGGSDQFAILANRIENAVEGYRARREIERAERRFRKLIEESVDIVAVFGPGGAFRYLSPAAESVVGYAPDDLVGEDVFEYLHPEDRERVWNRFASLFDGDSERVNVRCQFRGKDGAWIDLDVRGRDLIADPDVGGVLVYGQDATGRVQRDRELERYETMANESGDMIYTTDDRGYLTAVNDATVSFLGYAREELVGEHVAKIVTEESADRGRRAAVELRKTEDPDGVTIEQEYVTATGEVVPSEAHLTVLYDDDGTFHGAVGVVRDITARKEREETFRAVHSATHRLVAAGSREEVVDELVTTARDVLGLTLVGLWLYDDQERALVPAVYPEDPDLPEEPPTYREGGSLSWRAFAEGQSRLYNDLRDETGLHNPDTAVGSELVVPIGDHGLLNSGSTEPGAFDETDRYLADILARTAAAALDRIERETIMERLHGATRGLMGADDREAVADRTVATAREILGHTHVVFRLLVEEGELVPVAATDRVRIEAGSRPTYRPGEGTAGAAFERGEVVRYDTRELDDDVDRAGVGTLFCVPVGDHGVLTIGHEDPEAFDDADVQLARILAANAETAFDRITRERALARQNERLEEFASVASHDLRNPLNLAINHLELLAEEVDSDRVDRVEEALDRMDALIDDVLSLARGGRDVIDPSPLPLATVAREAWATVDPDSLYLSVEGDPGSVSCDRGRLRQLLENLFRNVEEHAEGATTVWVGRDGASFYVEDDGAGVPKADRERVFESRYTTGGDGGGFGLAIVGRIAQAHGWTVVVREGREGGARFEVSGVDPG